MSRTTKNKIVTPVARRMLTAELELTNAETSGSREPSPGDAWGFGRASGSSPDPSILLKTMSEAFMMASRRAGCFGLAVVDVKKVGDVVDNVVVDGKLDGKVVVVDVVVEAAVVTTPW